jgi:hypothetical protein
MSNYSLIYNPDPQQVLDDYKERLKAAEQERFANQVMKAQRGKFDFSRGLELLRHKFAGRNSQKFARTVSPTR